MTVRNLDALFNPKSIAVIGASLARGQYRRNGVVAAERRQLRGPGLAGESEASSVERGHGFCWRRRLA